MARDKKESGKGGGFDAFRKRHNPKAEKKNDRRREKEARKQAEKKRAQDAHYDFQGPVRLNRFIALAGVCSRREADSLIAAGKIEVNGKVTKELGTKVEVGKDKVKYNGKELKIKRFVYLLMNKPKNRISTVKDEQGRATVMDIVRKYTKVRVYPVGRLDRNTTGLLLFTNDGGLAKKLTHPSHNVPKLYHVRLDQAVDPEHLAALRKGIELEDGPAKADKVVYVEGGNENEVGIKIHSGRNRIVRRMFEHFGYRIVALDRVQVGPLTKKNLPRGQCRMLSDKEVGFLMML
ncbi:MAG: pseudouridine synthase [Bacteroidota bacterium]